MPTVGGLYLKWRELREIPFCGFIEVFCKKKTEGNVVADILVVLTLQLLTTVKLPLLQKTYIAVTYNGNIFPAASYLFKINNRNTSQSVTYVQR